MLLKSALKLGGDDVCSSCQAFESFSRARENSTSSSLLQSSQWEVLMRKFSADNKSKADCTLPRVDASTIESPRSFPTGSTYEGQWNSLGISGYGIYTYPNGVIYEGDFDDGVFHGDGQLRYPGGITLRGKWKNGTMVSRTIEFEDGNNYDEKTWDYCQMPDRRFTIERKKVRDKWHGLEPGTASHMTPEQPSREIPPGHYDTGNGLYDPNSGVAYHYESTTDMVRALGPAEQKWAVEHCRVGGDKPTGARPDLYEEWWNVERPEKGLSTCGRASATAWKDDESGRLSVASGWTRRIIKFDPGCEDEG